jgi:hypothetical protein
MLARWRRVVVAIAIPWTEENHCRDMIQKEHPAE